MLLADYWPYGEVRPGDISAKHEFEVKDDELAKRGHSKMSQYLAKGSPARARFESRFRPEAFFCRICRVRPTPEDPTLHIQIHHLSYRMLGHENLRDLLPLCEAHHKEVHKIQYEYGGRNSLSWYVAYVSLKRNHEHPTCSAS